jgi:hypothetical protein
LTISRGFTIRPLDLQKQKSTSWFALAEKLESHVNAVVALRLVSFNEALGRERARHDPT